MSAEEKVEMLMKAILEINEATYAEFQEHPTKMFDRSKHACPMCGRASTIAHLRSKWALVQEISARVIREIAEAG